MDATSALQGSLQDFIRPSKKIRVAILVFLALFAAMVAGVVYENQQPAPEPVRYSTAVDSGTYAYLDVQLLSEWIYKVTGDESHTYYEAMDPDQNWFVVDLPDATYSELEPFVDAYNFLFYEDMPYAEIPDSVRVYGVARSLDSETISDLASFYDVSGSDYTAYFGSCYLDESASPENVAKTIFLAGSIVFGVILLIMLLQNAVTAANYKKCDTRLYALGLEDDAEFEYTGIDNQRFDKAKLVLSEHFLYSGTARVVIPYTDILWLYKRVQRSYGMIVSQLMIAGLFDGRSVTVASRGVTDELMSAVFSAAQTQNPDILAGYSLDYARQYRARVKEFKANNRSS